VKTLLGLVGPRAQGDGVLPEAAATEEFEYQDGLVVAIAGVIAARGVGTLKFRDAGGQLGTGAGALAGGFENAGADEFGNELKLVGR
jgi:hypothetical protein